MKILPQIVSAEEKAAGEEKIQKITKKAALLFAGATTFTFFFKLLFF